MKLKLKNGLCLLSVVLCPILSAVAADGFKNAIAFHGFIKRADGAALDTSQPLKLNFFLRDQDLDSGSLLWARTIPVVVKDDGGFYTELCDEVGDAYADSTPEYSTLVEAISSGKELYLGFAPRGSKPHKYDKLESNGTAFAVARASKVSKAELESVSTKKLTANNATINTLNVKKRASVTNGSTLKVTVTKSNTQLNPGGAPLKVYGNIYGFRTYNTSMDGYYTLNDAYIVKRTSMPVWIGESTETTQTSYTAIPCVQNSSIIDEKGSVYCGGVALGYPRY